MVDHLIPMMDSCHQVCNRQSRGSSEAFDRLGALYPLSQFRVRKDFPLDDVGIVPVRPGDKELGPNRSIEDGPVSWRVLAQDGRHLDFWSGLGVPDEAFALSVDPNGEAIESVQPAAAGGIPRVNKPSGVKQLMIELREPCASILGELQSASESIEARAEKDSSVGGQSGKIMRPISANELEIALEAAGGEDDGRGAEFHRFTGAGVRAAHADNSSGIDDEANGLCIPNEREVRIAQALPINRANKADSTSRSNVLSPHTISRDNLRIQFPTGYSEPLQPIVDIMPRILCIESNPIAVGVFAEPDEIVGCQSDRITYVARRLFRSSDNADHAAGHHSMTTEDRSHVDDSDIRSRPGSLQSGRQAGNAGTDNDNVA